MVRDSLRDFDYDPTRVRLQAVRPLQRTDSSSRDVDMSGNKIPHDNVIHDFTHFARKVVEATRGHKLTAPSPCATQSPAASTILAIVRRGNLRSAVKLTGLPRNEVKRIVLRAGWACARFHARGEVHPKLSEVQCAVWPAMRDKFRGTVSMQDRLRRIANACTWTCMDGRTRFVPIWQVGPKDADSAHEFLLRAASIASAGLRVISEQCELWRNLNAVPDARAMVEAFGPPICFRHSAHSVTGRDVESDFGILAPWLAELTSPFAEKVRRYAAVLALLFTYHNFATENSSGGSPAMAAGVADHVWTVEEMLSATQPEMEDRNQPTSIPC